MYSSFLDFSFPGSWKTNLGRYKNISKKNGLLENNKSLLWGNFFSSLVEMKVPLTTNIFARPKKKNLKFLLTPRNDEKETMSFFHREPNLFRGLFTTTSSSKEWIVRNFECHLHGRRNRSKRGNYKNNSAHLDAEFMGSTRARLQVRLLPMQLRLFLFQTD